MNIDEDSIRKKMAYGCGWQEVMALIARPKLTREAANHIFVKFNARSDIYWAVDVRGDLLKRFVKDAEDPWWRMAWQEAKNEFDFISSRGGVSEDRIKAGRKEEWLNLINLLLQFPGISAEQLQWVIDGKRTDLGDALRDIYGAVLAYPGLDQEFAKALITSLYGGERTVALEKYLKAGAERGVLDGTYVLTEALSSLGTGSYGQKIGSKGLGILKGAQLMAGLSILSHANPQFLTQWLATDGRKRLAGAPREIINELMRSPHKEVRVAVVKLLGRAGPEGAGQAAGRAR